MCLSVPRVDILFFSLIYMYEMFEKNDDTEIVMICGVTMLLLCVCVNTLSLSLSVAHEMFKISSTPRLCL